MSERIEIERAFKLRERDVRARLLVDMAVAIAMEDARKQGVDPHRKPLQFAHDVARLAAAILIERLYSEDRELAGLRDERDHYKRQVEELITTQPPRLTVRMITDPKDKP